MTKTCKNCEYIKDIESDTRSNFLGECDLKFPRWVETEYTHTVISNSPACSFWKEKDSRGQCKCKDVFKGDVYEIVEDCPVHGAKR